MREPNTQQKLFLRWLSVLMVFLAGQYYDQIPVAEVLILAVVGGTVVVGAWLFAGERFREAVSPASRRPPSAGLRELLPNALTASRPFFAVAVGISLYSGDFQTAYALYLAGNATDVLDGAFARALNGRTAWGKQFDAFIDAGFNFITGAGVVYACASTYPSVDLPRLSAVGVNLALFAGSQIFWGPHSLQAKVASGLIRLVFVGILVSLTPAVHRHAAALVGIVLAALAFAYEYLVMRSASND